MLDGKLRIAPTCYHMLHQVPVMTAHEMNFFYDEGLVTAHGTLGYEILSESMVPFGLEKLGISQAMKEKAVDIALDVQSRTVFYQRARGADLYILCGWRQQHPSLGDSDSAEKGRVGSRARYRVGAARSQRTFSRRRDPQRQSRVRARVTLACRRPQERRLQCTGIACGSIS